jgi:hypothetical protein
MLIELARAWPERRQPLVWKALKVAAAAATLASRSWDGEQRGRA